MLLAADPPGERLRPTRVQDVLGVLLRVERLRGGARRGGGRSDGAAGEVRKADTAQEGECGRTAVLNANFQKGILKGDRNIPEKTPETHGMKRLA